MRGCSSAIHALPRFEYLSLKSRYKDLVIRIFGGFWPTFTGFSRILGEFLRDEITLGRGVHRFWGVPIQKSRSLFGLFFEFYPNFRVFGVGVLYWWFPGRDPRIWAWILEKWLSRDG